MRWFFVALLAANLALAAFVYLRTTCQIRTASSSASR
jgi:hypothetical protein